MSGTSRNAQQMAAADKIQAEAVTKCKHVKIAHGYFRGAGIRCKKPATRDGWCGVHHPDAAQKRKDARTERWRMEDEASQRRSDTAAFDRSAGEACRKHGITDPAKQIAKFSDQRAEIERLSAVQAGAHGRDATDHLTALVTALDNAFISSWQSTAAWQPSLDAAREFLVSDAAISKEIA